MEFLDDLLGQSESDEEPDDQQTQETTTDGEETTGNQPAELPPSSGATDEKAWADLLEGVDFEDADESAGSSSKRFRRAGGGGLTTAQKVTLGVLGVIVIALWVVVALIISRSYAAQRSPTSPADDTQLIADVPEDSTAETPESDQEVTDSVLTEEAEAVIVEATSPSEPESTPSPTPPVSTAYDNRILADPEDIDLYLQRGQTYIELEAYEAALTDFTRAQELDKTRPEIYVGQGWAHFYSGYWEQAEDSFGTAIALDEDLAEAHFGLGQVTYYQGRYKEAAREFDWAAEIDHTYTQAEAWLAIVSAKMDEPEEALGAATRAMSQTNELPVSYIAQSWARRIEDPPDIDGAQADLLYARELEPNSFLTLNALAKFYVDHRPDRLAEAEQLATYAIDWATNNVERAVALQTLGQVYLTQERDADAARALSQAADLVSKDGEVVLADLEDDLIRALE